MDARVQRVIELLDLVPHPEGGFYRETFRSDRVVTLASGKDRSAATAIYFLVPAGAFSAFHVLQGAEEIWHHYAGDPLELHQIAPTGEHRMDLLGEDLERGERPQLGVRAGSLQAAITRGDFTLCGCTVSPGFDFSDFEMPRRDDLLRRFPQHDRVIRSLTRA